MYEFVCFIITLYFRRINYQVYKGVFNTRFINKIISFFFYCRGSLLHSPFLNLSLIVSILVLSCPFSLIRILCVFNVPTSPSLSVRFPSLKFLTICNYLPTTVCRFTWSEPRLPWSGNRFI